MCTWELTAGTVSTHIGKLSGHDSEDFPETFSKIYERERSKGKKLNGPEGKNLTVQRAKAGRFKGMKLDGLKGLSFKIGEGVTSKIGLG